MYLSHEGLFLTLQKENPIVNMNLKFKSMKHKLFLSFLVVLLSGFVPLFAQQVNIAGTVVDKSTNDAIIGASVIVKGSKIGTTTDVNGKFSLKNVPKGSVVIVSYIGYKPSSVTITNSKAGLQVNLEEDSQALNEVVVVGYGTQKKVNLTGAVATVDKKMLDSRPVTSVAQALQGTVPGLNISAPTQGGRLDANPSINIRGTGNLGTGSSSSPLILIDGVEGDINTLNPQDIASISVLKDAASAAVYGSRAPFGVILITTKSGEQGKVSVQYSGNFRWSRPTHIPDMLDAYTFTQYFNRAKANNLDGGAAIFSDATIERIKKFMAGEITETADPSLSQASNCFVFNIRSNDNQNWPRNFIDKTAFGQEHNLSVSGGGTGVKYYLSTAYLLQDGQMNYTDDSKKRYNISGKITADITKWMTVELNTRFIREDISMPTFIKLFGDRFFSETTKLHPNMPLYDNNGHYTRNPKLMQLTSGGRSDSHDDNYFTQGSITLNPLKGLTVHADGTIQTENYNHQWNIAKVYLWTRDNTPVLEQWLGGDPDLAAGKTQVYSGNTSNTFLTGDVYADYTFTLNNAHNFKVMAGWNAEKYKTNNVWAKRFDVIDDNKPSINTANGTMSNGGSTNVWATMGYFGRLNYDYKGRYLFEFNIRYDGTSRFRGSQRWGTFPSVSFGWNIAREDFWAPLEKYVNTLKPRFSYGSLGNQNTNNWYPTYSIQNITVGTADAGGRWLTTTANKSNIASSPSLVSADLGWEHIYNYNFGLDFGALNNRLTGYFEYFIRDTKKMVGPAEEISPLIGASSPSKNNTSLRTKGWELQLSWQDHIQDLSYHVSFNISDSRSKVTKYPNASNLLSTYRSGQYLGEIWGFQTYGMAKTDEEIAAYVAEHDQSKLAGGTKSWRAGDMMYANLDEDPAITQGTTADKPGDYKVIGNSTPRYRFGLSLGAEWKGLDFNIFFQGVMKRDYWLDGMIFWGINGNEWASTGYREHMNFFRPENDELGANVNGYFPRPIMSSRQNNYTQSRYLQNAAYIRLKNLQVGYTLPKAWVTKLSIQKVRIFFSGDNLWTGTSINKDFDPEALYQNGMQYPLSRTLSCGVNIVL